MCVVGCLAKQDLERGESRVDQWNACKECIYHLLCAALGQRIAVSQIIYLHVSYVVAVLLVDVGVESATGVRLGGRLGCTRTRAGTLSLS